MSVRQRSKHRGLASRYLVLLSSLFVGLPLVLCLPSALAGGGAAADERGMGACVPITCLSTDPTNSPGCYKHFSDEELLSLLGGSESHPMDFPEVCGEVVETPEEARTILSTGGCVPCNRLRRDALTATLNIRRSILFGGGLLGEDGAACFGVGSFRIVLRCGSFFIPNPDTPDPDDALVVTERTPVSRLVELSNQLCELASCPPTNNSPCGKTIGSLAEILNRINASNTREGECGLCRGDGTAPVISCPEGTLEFEGQSPEGAAIAYRVTASDNCDPNPVVTCYPPPGTVLPVGTERTVQCTATDMAGNVTTCSFQVAVVDTTAPEIACPSGPIVVDCVPGTGGDGAVVNYPVPTASDVCDGSPSVVCEPPSGSFFPFGSTTVTCTATDDAGNSVSCGFDVEVVEETPVQLICPGDIVRECSGPDGAVVEYPPPMVTATCEAPPVPTCSPPSGSVFPLGTTAVTCTAQDSSGNTIECQFTVTITDTQPPLIACPQDLAVECSSNGGTPVSFEVTATDTCDASPSVVCDPPSGSLFFGGETVVLCTAADSSGNSSSCSFKVIVIDTSPPDIVCPQGPIRVDCNIKEGQPGAMANFPDPVALDACDASPTVVLSHASGSFFPLGTTTVTCTATDSSGNESSCSFDVEVVDETPPMLVCIGDMHVEATGPDGATVDYPLPQVADECDDAPLLSCEPPAGALFPIGTTTVNAIAMDESQNSIECSFAIVVEDSTPPELSLPADIIVENATPQGTQVQFTVTATDAGDPAPVVVATPPSGSFFGLGVTVVECTATDSFGNQSTGHFTVSVVDTTSPTITCPADIVAECQSQGGTAVTYAASATDACCGSLEVTCDPPSGSLFPVGATTVTCTVADTSGNQSQCQFQVTVVDTTPPAIVCPQGTITIECSGASSAPASYPLPTVVDSCDEAPQLVCEPPVGTVLPLGTHVVICTATDIHGNAAGCSFELEVVDTAPPALHCGDDVSLEATGPAGAVLTYAPPTPTDVCDPSPNLSCVPSSGSSFPLGKSTVSCTADDQSGNMIECGFSVTVLDSTPPAIQCPGDISRSCGGPNGTPVSFTVTATDTVDPSPAVNCVPPSGSTFPSGVTAVTCTATDFSGNTSTCTFNVTIGDDGPPEIVCPESFETACIEDGTALVEYPAPQATDACDPNPTVVCDPPSGSRLPRGTHRITCTAEDSAGNEASCEFTVTVIDTTPPVLVCPADVTVECAGTDGIAVDYALPTSNDACDGQRPVECVPPPGSVFALGQTEVVCRSTDVSGNQVECTFRINVRDTTPPTMSPPEPIVAEMTSPQGAIVEYTVTAIDGCGGDVTISSEPPSGSLFPPGQSTVTCTAEDASGNQSQCTFTVSVVDTTPPNLICPVDMIVYGTTAGNPPLSHAQLRWPPQEGPPRYAVTAAAEWPDPVATDVGQVEPPQVTTSPASGTRFALGEYTISCSARDLAGNQSTCTFQVTVAHGLHAFIRGDANLDSRMDIADTVATVCYLFLGTFDLKCLDAADSNDESDLDLADVVYTLSYLFRGGPEPREPFGDLCGLDPTDPDGLDCARYYPCE